MGTVLGRYNLVRKLAVGGMGEVWLARTAPRPGVPEAVVVKKLLSHLKSDEEFVNMFFDEARIASVLEHPNIAQIYDLGDDDGEYFIAMEFVHGMPLSELHGARRRGRPERTRRPGLPHRRRRRRGPRLRPPRA